MAASESHSSATARNKDARDVAVTVQGRHTVLDYIFFARPVLMPPVWTIALLGIAGAGLSRTAIPWWHWLAFFVHLSCLFGAVYTLNQIFDVESDRANHKLFFLPEGLITIRNAWRFTVVLNTAAMALAILFGPAYVGLSFLILVLGIAYSVGRQPLKNRPWGGFLANMAAHGLIVHVLGVVFAGRDIWESWELSLAYGCAVGGVYLATTVSDIPGDRQVGKRTFSVRYGAGVSMGIASALVFVAIGLALWTDDLALVTAGALTFPVFVAAFLKKSPGWASRAAIIAVLTLTLAAVILYPLYAVPLTVGFLATRAFFRWRFDFVYPTFG